MNPRINFFSATSKIMQEKNDLKNCKDRIHHISVVFYQKLLQFSQSETEYIKREDYGQVLNFLSQKTYSEENKITQNYFKILNKLPEIMKKYYALEFSDIIEIIESLKSSEIFELKSREENTEKVNFYEFLEEQIMSLDDFLDILKFFMIILSSLIGIFKVNFEKFDKNPDDEGITAIVNEQDVFISDLELLTELSDKLILKTNDSEYLQNTLYQLILHLKTDIVTTKSLLISNRSILILDSISSISNLIVVKKNIAIIKKKCPNMMDYKIYVFFIHFYIDNYAKYVLIFTHYLDEKKNFLTMKIFELQSSSSTGIKTNINICEELFAKKKDLYTTKFMDIYNQEKLEISYFVLCFNIKLFLNSKYYQDNNNNFLKFQYKITNNTNQMFSELSENFGLISLFHIDPQINNKQILADVESYIGNINITENGLGKNFYGKHKLGNQQFLILTPVSNFIFVALKYKEKLNNDEKVLMDNLKDLKKKFYNFHVFKYLLSEN